MMAMKAKNCIVAKIAQNPSYRLGQCDNSRVLPGDGSVLKGVVANVANGVTGLNASCWS